MINEVGKKGLDKYLDFCARHGNIDIDKARITTRAAIRNHNKPDSDKSEMVEMDNLMGQWYNSLSSGVPDYSVYESPYYFCETWLCWTKYSRQYLKDIVRLGVVSQMVGVNTVVDLGNGVGYTTSVLKRDIFPNATVYGTNVVGSHQYTMAEDLGNQYGFTMLPDHSSLGSVDLIFASEYFEHWDHPIEHLEDILINTNPRYLLLANAFTQDAIGHFNEYYHGGVTYTKPQMNRLFNKTMKKWGYEKIATKCWNGRLAFWRKIENNTVLHFTDA